MPRRRLLELLAAATGVGLTAFLSSSVLYGLLLRLGDGRGTTWVGWIAVIAAGATVTVTSLLVLLEVGWVERSEGPPAGS